jgi:hypothetical protein
MWQQLRKPGGDGCRRVFGEFHKIRPGRLFARFKGFRHDPGDGFGGNLSLVLIHNATPE